ncbi:conserved hypothetical protein [Ralstonia solanacearum IPO1609]|uniref:Transmembrane protein n=1 Tax=Ralstonia solanacearum IPO1609 TaxID=564066 RepID=A0ABF7RHU3_RALSL|nr:conserved hypothetical protein [Ralstonia solanacearum IPO1609]
MSSFRSAWAAAGADTPADLAPARTGQSVPLLSAAAALAVAIAVSGWLSGPRHAPTADATQIESWRAMVAQATEPLALRQLRRLARNGSAPAQAALGEALLDGHDASLRNAMKGCAGWKPPRNRPMTARATPGPGSRLARRCCSARAAWRATTRVRCTCCARPPTGAMRQRRTTSA